MAAPDVRSLLSTHAAQAMGAAAAAAEAARAELAGEMLRAAKYRHAFSEVDAIISCARSPRPLGCTSNDNTTPRPGMSTAGPGPGPCAPTSPTLALRKGQVPLQTLRANVDYNFRTANTIYGLLGIKVWTFQGFASLEEQGR